MRFVVENSVPVQTVLVNTDWAMTSYLRSVNEGGYKVSVLRSDRIKPNRVTACGSDKYGKGRAKKSCRNFLEESREIWINVIRILVITNM
jgi:hypothetical protein